MGRRAIGLAFALFFLVSPNLSAASDEVMELLPEVPVPLSNPQSDNKTELGNRLFLDPLLSGDNTMSCATCHNPSLGFSSGLKLSLNKNQRHDPTLFNIGYSTLFFWDGRAKSLEEQAVGPITSKTEMNQDPDELIRELEADGGYRELFAKAFGSPGISMERITMALASFERTIVTGEAPLDRYLKGDQSALTDAQKRGKTLFEGKAGCVTCHSGQTFSDDGFHNIGVSSIRGKNADLGRFNILKLKTAKGAFKTPGLRNVSLNPPYMHDGSLATLGDVVSFYNKGGKFRENLDPQIRELKLTKEEMNDLVEFLLALTAGN